MKKTENTSPTPMEQAAVIARLTTSRDAHRLGAVRLSEEITRLREELAVLREAAEAARGHCTERMSYGPSAEPGAVERHAQSCEECQASARLDEVLRRTT